MARARNIKPGLYKNEDLAECSVWARYIFPGLWTLADREGRLEDRPKRIKAELLPFDTQDVEPLLRELHAGGFIVRYLIDGERYIQISKFKEHQSPHYSEKASVIKPPPLPESKPHIGVGNSGSDPPIKKGSQPPDSLIPDSPTVDSGLSDSPNQDVAASNNAPTVRGAMARALRDKGVKGVTPAHPAIDLWAKESVPLQLLLDAVTLARDEKPEPERIPMAYLESIVERIRREPPRLASGPRRPWFIDSASAIVAKGAEKGINEGDFETFPTFRAAVFEAYGITPEQVRQAEADWKAAA